MCCMSNPVCVLSCSVFPTLCNNRDCSPPGSSVCGILQAIILEWIAISSFRFSPLRDRTYISKVSCMITGLKRNHSSYTIMNFVFFFYTLKKKCTGFTLHIWTTYLGFPGDSDGKDLGSVPRLGISPGEGNGYPLQLFYLESSMDKGDW